MTALSFKQFVIAVIDSLMFEFIILATVRRNQVIRKGRE
jgi:hypothetical protein